VPSDVVAVSGEPSAYHATVNFWLASTLSIKQN
jgi:hypothetical protein